MAEPDAPVDTAPAPVVETPPSTPAPAAPEAPPAQSTPLWQELGYQSPDELKTSHTQYKQRLTDTTTQAQQAQRDLDARNRELDDYRARMAALVHPQAPAEKQYGSLQAAYEGYLDGDTSALQRYEVQQQERMRSTVMETMTSALLPTQYSEAVVSEFPDLAKPESPLYKAVYEQYDGYAAHPRHKLFFGEQPAALRDAPAPDGIGSKQVDMRIIYQLAHKVSVDLARQEGRTDEARRRSSADGQAPSGGRATEPAQDPWAVLTPGERRSIEDMVSRNLTPPGWPSVADQSQRKVAFARHIMERRQKRGAA